MAPIAAWLCVIAFALLGQFPNALSSPVRSDDTLPGFSRHVPAYYASDSSDETGERKKFLTDIEAVARDDAGDADVVTSISSHEDSSELRKEPRKERRDCRAVRQFEIMIGHSTGMKCTKRRKKLPYKPEQLLPTPQPWLQPISTSFEALTIIRKDSVTVDPLEFGSADMDDVASGGGPYKQTTLKMTSNGEYNTTETEQGQYTFEELCSSAYMDAQKYLGNRWVVQKFCRECTDPMSCGLRTSTLRGHIKDYTNVERKYTVFFNISKHYDPGSSIKKSSIYIPECTTENTEIRNSTTSLGIQGGAGLVTEIRVAWKPISGKVFIVPSPPETENIGNITCLKFDVTELTHWWINNPDETDNRKFRFKIEVLCSTPSNDQIPCNCKPSPDLFLAIDENNVAQPAYHGLKFPENKVFF